MKKNIPIALRTRNRFVYLDVTLKSLLASDLPVKYKCLILDDCSDEIKTKEYLFTNNKIEVVDNKNIFPNKNPDWIKYVGEIKVSGYIEGIKNKIEVVQPKNRKGVKGGIFWCIDYMFSRFTNCEEIIIIEADVVFNKDWYNCLIRAYEECKNQKGYNGDKLGLLSVYDRKGKTITDNYSWCWRSVKKLSNGKWSCGNGIGGCMYLVTRNLYESGLTNFKKQYPVNARSGDTALQALAGALNLNIAVTIPSMIQHIGIDSLAWKEKGWRYTKNFLKPFCFKNKL